MPVTLQMRAGVIEIIFRGRITAQDLWQHLEELRDIESRLEVTPNRVADLTDSDASELLSSDVADFARSRRETKLKNRIKTAIIAPHKSIQYGLARMFQTLNENPAIEIVIFHDAASAHDWIGLGSKPALKETTDRSPEPK